MSLEPIVETRAGELSFLVRRGDGSVTVRDRETDFPTIANMQTVLAIYDRASDETEYQVRSITVRNNLAAVHLLRDEVEVAWGLLSEAESLVTSLIRASPKPDSRLAIASALIKFNACVAALRADDPDAQALAGLSRRHAADALKQVVEGSNNDQYRFLAAALNGIDT